MFLHRFKIICLLLIFLLFNGKIQAQSYQKQQRGLLLYNVGIGAVIGGVGGLINKKKDEKWHEAFLKNFAFGSLGGLVSYHAKYLTYESARSKHYALNHLNRAYYFVGYSLINNASRNEPVWSRYTFQLYLLNLDVHFTKKPTFQPRISMASLLYTGRYLVTGHRISLNKSWRYGVVFFDRGPELEKHIAFGASNLIGALDGYENLYDDPSFVIPHEMVHTYQFADFYSLSNFARPLYPKVQDKKGIQFLNKYFYFDVPYTHLAYTIQNLTQPPPVHYNNFFEYEAQSFASRQYIQR